MKGFLYRSSHQKCSMKKGFLRNFYDTFFIEHLWTTTSVYKTIKQKQPQEVFYKKKVFLKISQNSQENTCARACNFLKKGILAEVFSCEFYEVLNNTYFKEHHCTTASEKCCTSTPSWESRKNFQRYYILGKKIKQA